MPLNISDYLKSTQSKDFVFIHDYIKQNFSEFIKSSNMLEVISFPTKKELLYKKILVPEFLLLFGKEVYYSLSDYIDHLKNIIVMLKKHENYNVLISDKDILNSYQGEDFSVVTKDFYNSIFFNRNPDYKAYITDESHMSIILWQSINSIINSPSDKKDSINIISDYIEKLDSYI